MSAYGIHSIGLPETTTKFFIEQIAELQTDLNNADRELNIIKRLLLGGRFGTEAAEKAKNIGMELRGYPAYDSLLPTELQEVLC